MIYCQVPAPDAVAWSATPAIRSLGADGGAWLVPPVAGTPLKLSAASACRVVPEIGDQTTPPYWRDHLIDAFSASIPGLTAGWLTGARDCYYLARASAGGPMLAVLADRVVLVPGVRRFVLQVRSAYRLVPGPAPDWRRPSSDGPALD